MPAVHEHVGKLIQGKMAWSDFTEGVRESLKEKDWYDDKLVKAAEEPKKLLDEVQEIMGSKAEMNNALPSLLFMRRHFLRQRNTLIPSSDDSHSMADESASKSVKNGREKLVARLYRYMVKLDSLCTKDAEASGIAPRDVLCDYMRDMDYKPELPRHTIYIDHLTESVVLIMQGTASAHDVIKDLVADSKKVLNGKGYSHKGMADGAELMLEETMPRVVRALKAYPDYCFTIVGHSLGAGVAIMMALTLRIMETQWEKELPEGALKSIQVVAYAPPPTWAPLEELSDDDVRGIHILANNVDMIPRSTLRSMEMLVNTVHHIDKALEGHNPMALFQTLCKKKIGDEVDDEEGEGDDENDGDGKKESVDETVAKAVQKAQEEAEAAAEKEAESEGSSHWLHRQLFHPCPVLHMYPVLSEDMEDTRRFTHGRTAEIPKSYRLQEVSPREFASLPLFEGDGFINDHLTAPVMEALLHLDNGKPFEVQSHKVQGFSE